MESSNLRADDDAECAGAKRRLGATWKRSVLLACLFATALGSAGGVQAQAGRGVGPDALPGVHEVPFAAPSEENLRARAGAGYGWTESVLGLDDSHHRLQLDAAASFTPRSWLSAALRLLGRYDVHSGADDSDSGLITETHLGARAGLPLGADFDAGAQLELWLPAGDSVGDALSAVSGDLQLLAAYAPPASGWMLGLALGLRLDRSSEAGGDPLRYSAADRLALGASDATLAARLGLALSYRSGSVEWLTEWAYRMYFDYVAESPMWIRAGARYHASDSLQLELLLGVSPSKRPPLDEDAALAVVEPRLWGGLAATYAWGLARLPAAEPEQAAREPGPLAPRDNTISGKVLAASGTPLPDATVTLRSDGGQTDAVSDAAGAFAFPNLPPGRYELGVSAPGFIASQQEVLVQASERPELTITLERELPSGQIRGTVRRFNGRPVRATVAITELGITQSTRDDGSFEIDVQPGEYAVAVSAPGFRPQTRNAEVELRGVAILIIELEPSR